MLTSADSGSMSAIDVSNLIAEIQDQLIGVNGALPFMTPDRIAQLPSYIQDISYFQLLGTLAQMNPTDPTVRFPYMTTEVGGNPIQIEGQANPDNIFNFVFTQPDGTYVIHFAPGSGTVDFNITSQYDFSPSNVNSPPGNGLQLADLTPNSDGSYTITVSPIPTEGNWIDSDGATGIWIRDTVHDWTASPGALTIERTDIAPSDPLYTPLSDSDVATLLGRIADELPEHNLNSQVFYTPPPNLPTPDNGVIPFIPTNINGGLPGQFMSFGNFNLEPGQALILKAPEIDATYYNIQLSDPVGRLLPFQYSQTSLNDIQSFQATDGNTYYVISATNPGVPNWLDTGGLGSGGIFLRIQGPEGPIPSDPLQAEVVPVGDIRDYLPADTPVVTPEEFAAQLELRAFSLDNLLSLSKDSSWITTNLQIDDIKAAIGSGTFDQLFGTQDSYVSLAERFTDIFDPSTAIQNIISNPLGSMSAVVQALPQAFKEVEYSLILAMARGARALAETLQSIDNGMSSGNSVELFSALAQPFAAPDGLASVFAQTIFDPGTSITAGLLNARDAIQFALVTGVHDTPDLWQLATAAQESLAQIAAMASHDFAMGMDLVDQLLGF
ncbi:hypothetical protein AWC24_01215 [Mycolicibacter senuensis]|nr:hypothetical protein AWC24_01215 [Mycolicibacter senuensis]